MPLWERTIMSQRLDIVERARAGESVRALCRERGVSPDSVYRWLRRYEVEGPGGLLDRTRRPHTSPGRTSAVMEALVVALRGEHPTWGGRKLARRLRDLGHQAVPSPSTVTAILRRHDLLSGRAGAPRAYTRFEHAEPNALWQLDFKGHVPCADGRCHPLTALDDHSRFDLVLAACADERTRTVHDALVAAFRVYGLPERMAMDNGSPWGSGPGEPFTPLGVWLLRLGVRISHSRPYHPQTLGKEERFHRTLKAELLGVPLLDLASAQALFDRWRHVYNHERPHEALGGDVPASRYRPSLRAYPETLPPLEYASGDLVRRVQSKGVTHLLGRLVSLPKAFRGYPVAFRPTDRDGCFTVHFATVQIAEVDLTVTPRGQLSPVRHVPEHPSDMSPV